MNKTYSFFFVQILFIIYFIHIDFCKVCAGVLRKEEDNLNKVFEALHSMYKDAFENEKTYITRRLFTQNDHSHYTLHVQKLKDVNGVKTHNLRVEGRTKPDSPVIYINNPVEAGMPNPFLGIEEFKNAMRERVEKQKKEFNVKSKLILNAHKTFKALNHKDNISNEIFDVKKDIEFITINSTDKPMTTALRKINNKLNRKRKQKFVLRSTTAPRKGNKKRAQKGHVSRATKSSHLKNTTTLPKPIIEETVADEELTRESSVHEKKSTTKLTRNEEITTESPAIIKKSPFDEVVTTKSPANGVVTLKSTDDEVITTKPPDAEVMTTKSPANEEVTIKSLADEIITTKPVDKVVSSKESTPNEVVTTKLPADELITTQSPVEEVVTTKSPAKEEVTTKSPVDEVERSTESTLEEVERSTESTRDEVVTTKLPADEVVTTVSSVGQLVPTEAITEVEIVTEPVTTIKIRTTTKRGSRKTRHKQYRPYVFVGGRDPEEIKNE